MQTYTYIVLLKHICNPDFLPLFFSLCFNNSLVACDSRALFAIALGQNCCWNSAIPFRLRITFHLLFNRVTARYYGISLNKGGGMILQGYSKLGVTLTEALDGASEPTAHCAMTTVSNPHSNTSVSLFWKNSYIKLSNTKTPWGSLHRDWVEVQLHNST